MEGLIGYQIITAFFAKKEDRGCPPNSLIPCLPPTGLSIANYCLHPKGEDIAQGNVNPSKSSLNRGGYIRSIP